MARARTRHVCTDCGSSSPRWVGRCPGCGAWNTLVEEPVTLVEPPTVLPQCAPARLIGDVSVDEIRPEPTGVVDFDRVLGGGLLPGSVTLVGGEPGVGKSTLLLQAAAAAVRGERRSLYLTAEESAGQIASRAARVGVGGSSPGARGLWLGAVSSLADVLDQVDAVGPAVVVVDSIQTIHDSSLEAAPGSVSQVRACAHRLVQLAKQRACAIVLVGHVTKDGGLAGPRVLEHVVDTVVMVEGDRHHSLRLLRVPKHRFGATGELGVVELGERGFVSVPDASGLLLADRHPWVSGSIVAPVLEGRRPILVEVQALVGPALFGGPKRSAQGFDVGRLAMLCTVLDRRAGVGVANADVHASVVGGVRVDDPALDLAVALAIASAVADQPISPEVVACAEIGLGGELRSAGRTDQRLLEANRLGFTRAVLAPSAPGAPDGMSVHRAFTLGEAIESCGLFAEDIHFPPRARRRRTA